VSRQDDSIDYLTTALSLRAKREGSYLHGAPSAPAVRNRNYAVNQAVHTYRHIPLFQSLILDLLTTVSTYL
jgi:hypothetical protein